MFERNQDVLSTLYIIVVFIAFISGFFLGALISPNRRKEREPWYARLAAAEAKPRHDGKDRNTNLLAVVIALIVVSSVIVLDHFKGPLFPDVAYCLSDGGAQITRICTADRNLIAKSA